MTGTHARLASRASIEIDREGILLTFLWTIQRDQIAIVTLLGWERVAFVFLCEPLHGGEPLLGIEQGVDQRARFGIAADHASLLKNSWSLPTSCRVLNCWNVSRPVRCFR